MAERLEEGESKMLRTMEKKRGATAEAYDALKSTTGHHSAPSGLGEEEPSPRAKPSFSRLVRKIMAEKQNLESQGTSQPTTRTSSRGGGGGHARTRSNAQVYNLLKTMKEAQSQTKLVDDVFQQDIFYQEQSLPSQIPQDNIDIDVVGPAPPVDEEQQVPVDSTPLLPNDEAAVRRIKELKQVRKYCDASSIKAFFWGLWCHCWLLIFAALFAGFALVLFYNFENPKIDALPGNASLAWWCNWIARQFVLFEAARIIKYLLLDCIILGFNWTVKIVGPFVTLLALQAKGWPFVLAVWGILIACFLQGNNAFQNHWLYQTGWAVYSLQANSGLHIISSETYLRLLICMIVAGVATALKRTLLAISFGRRQYGTFKPRLEKLLLDVVLLNEVANLSVHAQAIHQEMDTSASQEQQQQPGIKKPRKKLADVSWESVKMQQSEDNDESEGADDKGRGYVRSRSSGTFLKSLLDRWEEPASNDKSEASIQDVLRFRRALAFMDETFPFGEDFGAASTRDEAIASAERVYHSLCKISALEGRLPFETLALIAIEDDGSYDEVKKRAVRRLFHPDRYDSLTLLAFVQSCDTLYRHLRYFLATVNNSASLDKVLENVLNTLYYFILGLFLLSLMNVNAWSLLLSLTSLLVSFSFAFGQTVSRYVQGIILIAVTRPFDLGDRIFLAGAGEIEKGLENAQNGWFVEDITLSSTKLRFARTGEVAYLSNHLLTDMRIYNANRSPNATVVLQHILHIAVLDHDNLKKFEDALRKFVSERPRQWVDLLLVCVVRVDSDMEQVFFNLAFRHRDSWQTTARIYMHRAELIQYIQHISKKLQIVFETPPPRRVLYYGGDLDQGAVAGEDDHRKDLLRAQNVRSNSAHIRERSHSVPSPLSQMGM